MPKQKVAKSKKTSKRKTFNINMIDEVIADPYDFIKTHDIKIISKIIKYSADKYYNDISVLPDPIYDLLIDHIKDTDPTNVILKKVGALTMSKDKVKLPYYMGSMDKIRPTELSFLDKWKEQHMGPYVYSDKLDGVSGLLVFNDKKLNLYTRGDGLVGQDITKLINYIPSLKNINIGKLEDGLAVRGELIISKENFKKHADKMANARNMTSGIVNSKTIDVDNVKDVDFVTYDVINPWITSQVEQWKLLAEYGFMVVEYSNIDQIDFKNLSDVLTVRKEKSKYEIDGIIITNNVLPDERVIKGNPEYSFAFKSQELMARANIVVKSVEWNVSKDHYIKPIINLVPTRLGGVTISNTTGFNAKYIKDKIIGPGAIVEIIRSGDVIPYVTKVIKSSDSGEPQLPDNVEYIWNESGVDIIATEETSGHKIKELTNFFKRLDIKNVDEASVEKMINANINTIPKIINVTKEQLSEVDGFKEKMVDKIYDHIHERLETINMLDIMVASNTFGHGMGERKLKKVMESYPDVIQLYTDYDKNEIILKIKELDGFDIKTAEYFEEGLNKFIELFNTLSANMRKHLRISIIKFVEDQDKIKEQMDQEDNIFSGKIFVFSGFRNDEWEKIITSNGGKISNSVSSKTSVLVTTQKDLDEGKNSKIVKANELKVMVLTREEFEKQFINVYKVDLW